MPHRPSASPPGKIPLLLAGIAGAVLLAGAGCLLFADPWGGPAEGDRRARVAAAGPNGMHLFTLNCSACHQTAGIGMPGKVPPLAGSEWVLGDERVLASILLNGVEGELTVGGTAYAGTMPAFWRLSDAELAAIASYARSSWNNRAAPVSPELFAAQRRENARVKPFAGGAELKALAGRSP